jgi:hypothetical protein
MFPHLSGSSAVGADSIVFSSGTIYANRTLRPSVCDNLHNQPATPNANKTKKTNNPQKRNNTTKLSSADTEEYKTYSLQNLLAEF